LTNDTLQFRGEFFRGDTARKRRLGTRAGCEKQGGDCGWSQSVKLNEKEALKRFPKDGDSSLRPASQKRKYWGGTKGQTWGGG